VVKVASQPEAKEKRQEGVRRRWTEGVEREGEAQEKVTQQQRRMVRRVVEVERMMENWAW